MAALYDRQGMRYRRNIKKFASSLFCPFDHLSWRLRGASHRPAHDNAWSLRRREVHRMSPVGQAVAVGGGHQLLTPCRTGAQGPGGMSGGEMSGGVG